MTWRLAPVVLWLGVVFAIGSSTALPLRPGDTARLILRKSIHVAEYAVMGFLAYRAMGGSRARFSACRALLAIVAAIAVGGLDEWHQTFVHNRSGKILDVSIDAVGAGLAQIVAWADAVLHRA